MIKCTKRLVYANTVTRQGKDIHVCPEQSVEKLTTLDDNSNYIRPVCITFYAVSSYYTICSMSSCLIILTCRFTMYIHVYVMCSLSRLREGSRLFTVDDRRRWRKRRSQRMRVRVTSSLWRVGTHSTRAPSKSQPGVKVELIELTKSSCFYS